MLSNDYKFRDGNNFRVLCLQPPQHTHPPPSAAAAAVKVQPSPRSGVRVSARVEPALSSATVSPTPHGAWAVVLRRVYPTRKRGASCACRRETSCRELDSHGGARGPPAVILVSGCAINCLYPARGFLRWVSACLSVCLVLLGCFLVGLFWPSLGNFGCSMRKWFRGNDVLPLWPLKLVVGGFGVSVSSLAI